MKLHFLKTKWSDIIILEHNGTAALVDTGFAEQYEQLSSYLHNMGISELSFILLTHFHRDHYGCIPSLLDEFPTECVYFKEYSGYESMTAWGTPADDEYRQGEITKCREMKELIIRRSRLVNAGDTDVIRFGPYELKLFSAGNSIKAVYEDETHPETCGKIIFSENQNSLGVFIKADGKNIFLGGDIMDIHSSHPLADRVALQIAKQIGEQIDIYKAPHHGTVNTALSDTLGIYRPKLAVITNEDAYLREHSDVYQLLREAYPDVRIMLTENEDVVIDTADNI